MPKVTQREVDVPRLKSSRLPDQNLSAGEGARAWRPIPKSRQVEAAKAGTKDQLELGMGN